MRHITYKTNGTCSRSIDFDIDENNIVSNVSFFGGCNGNLKGISSLSEGMEADKLIKKLKDIKCGTRNTSCPAQFAKALEQAIGK